MTQSTEIARVGCGAFITRGEQVLLIRRRRAPEAGCWALPGGKVEFCEPLDQAARRETREEIGVVIEITELLCLVDHIDPAGDFHWVSPVYLATISEGEPANLEPRAIEDLAWFDIANPPASRTKSVAVALEAYATRRGHPRPGNS